MGRADFRADVAALIEEFKAKLKGKSPLQRLEEGTEDGMVTFKFNFGAKSWVEVSICVENLHLYPAKSDGYLYVGDSSEDEIASTAADVLQSVSISSTGISSIVRTCALQLCEHGSLSTKPFLEMGSAISPPGLSAAKRQKLSSNDSDDDDEEEEGDHSDFAIDSEDDVLFSDTTPGIIEPLKPLLVRDWKELKSLGYHHVGYLTHPGENGFMIYFSVKVSKLVASTILTSDQCEAWSLPLDTYVVTIMKFDPEYMEVVSSKGISYVKGMNLDNQNLFDKPPKVAFRVLASPTAEIQVGDARACFRTITANTLEGAQTQEGPTSLTQFLLSWTLSDLLNNSVGLTQFSRAGAELVYRKRHAIAGEPADPTFLTPTSVNAHSDWEVAKAADDEEGQTNREGTVGGSFHELYELVGAPATEHVDRLNFLLLALRFIMRRMKLASRFCLVCHMRTHRDLESLRPFVCDSSLCTYQYMQLGLGPSIELEILHNPTVVDMLISFAYIGAASAGGRGQYNSTTFGVLDPFPVGVGVENVEKYSVESSAIVGWNGITVWGSEGSNWTIDGVKRTADNASQPRAGDTLEIHYGSHVGRYKILSVVDCKCLKLETSISKPFPAQAHGLQLTFSFYRKEWRGWAPSASDPTLADNQLIVDTLQKLPSVDTLVSIIDQLRRGVIDPLPQTTEECPPNSANLSVEDEEPPFILDPELLKASHTSLNLRPCLDKIDRLLYPLLRWIICSNRSYFRELVDPKERLVGVTSSYKQFKMVTGSPDKEERFMKERNKECANLPIKSLWAFHGSPMANWHSILRHGLHYKKISHGRAYGNGIYHALDSATSLGYAQPEQRIWKRSKLRITMCMSLNEIVNRPDKFTSTQPYLVVPNVDWVQTRFLLVHMNQIYTAPKKIEVTTEQPGVSYLKMDTTYRPTFSMKQLLVPEAIIAAAHCQEKKGKATRAAKNVADEGWDFDGGFSALMADSGGHSDTDDDDQSEDDDSDEEMDFDDGAFESIDSKPKVPVAPEPDPMEELSLMPPPEYATTSATKALHKELMNLLKAQQKTKEEERGWILDVANVTNIYQWTVRLAHFDEKLPLQQDLRAKGGTWAQTGIVLEVRFGPDFPMTPPYVRVVKPRFMQFMHGGGGHVTAGGSICMDLLTMSGWSPAYSIEATLLQIRMALTSVEPRPARLSQQHGWDRGYSPAEAIDAFVRVARQHGWEVPKGWEKYFNGVA
ncbi:hypothetical protein HK104_001273 [Borealophlyctis nickersoniae]|nr:hypothetical protein HK104_001273 [Borealophlyctis nickersoniae]